MDWTNWTSKERPSFVPPGYVFSTAALEEIGPAMFEEDWTGRELTFCHGDMTNGLPSPELVFLSDDDDAVPSDHMFELYGAAVWFWLRVSGPLTTVIRPNRGQWRQAYELFAWHLEHGPDLIDRKRQLWENVQLFAAGGFIHFAAANQATGEMFPISAARWNCDREIAEGRLQLGKVNLLPGEMMRPLDTDWRQRNKQIALMTSWLFVTKRSLDDFISALNGDPDALAKQVAVLKPVPGADAASVVMPLFPDATPPPVETPAMPVAAPAKVAKVAKAPVVKRARPGPSIDHKWRDKVHTFCDKVGEVAVREGGSQEAFLRLVKEYYGLPENAKPTSPKRTHDFRQEWLDIKAGLPPRYVQITPGR